MELSRTQRRNLKKRERAAQKADKPEPPDGQVPLQSPPTDVAPTALELQTQLVQFGLPLVEAKLAEAGENSDFDESDCHMMLRSMDIISTILAQGLRQHRTIRTAANPDPVMFFTCDWYTSDPQKATTRTTRAMQTERAIQSTVTTQTKGQQAVRTRGVTDSVAPSQNEQEGTDVVLPKPNPKGAHTKVYDEMWIAASKKAEQELYSELQLHTQSELTTAQQSKLREKTIAMYRAKKKKCKAKSKKH